MFNFSGSEIVFLLLLALIILGPEKLPEAVRKFGKTYAEFKKVTTGFQSELKSALDEPMREMRETAEAFKQAAQFDVDLDPKSMFGGLLGNSTTPTPASEAAESAAAALPTDLGAGAVDDATAPTDAAAPPAKRVDPPFVTVRERGPAFTSAAPRPTTPPAETPVETAAATSAESAAATPAESAAATSAEAPVETTSPPATELTPLAGNEPPLASGASGITPRPDDPTSTVEPDDGAVHP